MAALYDPGEYGTGLYEWDWDNDPLTLLRRQVEERARAAQDQMAQQAAMEEAQVAAAPPLAPPTSPPGGPYIYEASPELAEPVYGPPVELASPELAQPTGGGGVFGALGDVAGEVGGFFGDVGQGVGEMLIPGAPNASGFQPERANITQAGEDVVGLHTGLGSTIGGMVQDVAAPLDYLPGATYTNPVTGEVYGQPYSETLGAGVEASIGNTLGENVIGGITGFIPGVDDVLKAGARAGAGRLAQFARPYIDDTLGLAPAFRAGIGPGDDALRESMEEALRNARRADLADAQRAIMPPEEQAMMSGQPFTPQPLTPEVAQSTALRESYDQGEFLSPTLRGTPEPVTPETPPLLERPYTPDELRAALRGAVSEAQQASISPGRIFHEGNTNDLFDVLPGSGRVGGTSREWWFARNPDLAIGQGNRRGVLMEFDESTVGDLVARRSKPAAGFTGPELYQEMAPNAQSIRAVTVKPDAFMDNWERTRIQTYMDKFGWGLTQNADGSITYTRPVQEAQQAPGGVSAGPVQPPSGSLAGGAGAAPAAPQDEAQAIRDFLANAPAGGRVPARNINPATRDEAFAAVVNSPDYRASTQSALGSQGLPIESAQEAIETGRRLGYSDADIAAYLRRNYIVPAAPPPGGAAGQVPQVPAGVPGAPPPVTRGPGRGGGGAVPPPAQPPGPVQFGPGRGQGGVPPVEPPTATGATPNPNAAERATWRDELAAILGIPRALKATWDLSAPGRQGLGLAFRHPVEWMESWKPMVQAWASPRGQEAVDREIADMLGAWTDDIGNTPVHLYETGASAPGLERVPGFEAVGKGKVAEFIRKIPGIGNSERAYATFLNYQKAKTFDNMATALRRSGELNPERYRNLGDIIDHATGYGAAPLKGNLEAQALFSQRFFTSRFQFLVEPIYQALVKQDMGAARAATENLVAFGGGMAGILALGNETGVWDAEVDPRSTDFGKIRIGPQRIDFGAGMLPILRTAARMASGEATNITGGEWGVSPGNEALKFLRNKAAPLPAQLIDRALGENAIGEKVPALLSLQTARDIFMPLIVDAVWEAYAETGDPVAAIRGGLAEFVGGGTTTYGSGQVAQAEIAYQQYKEDYDSLHAADQAAVNRAVVAASIELPWKQRQEPWWTARDDALQRWQADLPENIRSDPFVQQALKLETADDMAIELEKWAMKQYGISRVQAAEAVKRFMTQTKPDRYVQAYRKDVLVNDPGLLDAWDEAYENGEVNYTPSTTDWVQDFMRTRR